MEEMVEVRKEVSDMPCGNAIPAEDAGHQTEKDVAGRESDRVPAPEMNPKVQLELLSGEGRKKAIGAVVIYNAVTIRGISVVENSKKNPFVKMPRAPKGARTKHSDIAYPINRAAREMLYSAVLQEYDRLRSEEELRRQETKLQFPDLKTRPLMSVKAHRAFFRCSSSGQKRGKTMDTSKSYLSKVVKEMPDSGIKDFFDIANTMEGALSLGVGEPDFPTPEHVREAAIASIKRGETKYTDNRGTVELRAAAAEYLEKFGLHYDRENEILITMGASEGIDLALRALVDPGDEVLVVEPCYVSYIPCVELCGGIPVSIPLKAENKFRLTKEELEEKDVILNHGITLRQSTK